MQFTVTHAHPGKTLNRPQPDSASCGSMDTIITTMRISTKIDFSPLAPELITLGQQATACGNNAVDCFTL